MPRPNLIRLIVVLVFPSIVGMRPASWPANFRQNLALRGLDPARHAPVHGTMQSDEEVLLTLRNAEAEFE